jgi:predicted nucleic acid-binding protein
VSRRRDIDVILLPESADARVDFVLEEAVICVPTVEVDVCRDAKGNYLIALAEEAAAAFLVTDDADLLALKRWSSTEIVTPGGFFVANPQLR